MMIAVIANMHGTATDRTGPILDIQGHPVEYSTCGPTISHDKAILFLKSLDV
jgi:hypothetical protein